MDDRICTNCNTESEGKFCFNCGHARTLTRINSNYIISEIGAVFNFDKGILYTVKELLIRPGKSIRKFILEDRNRLVKPIMFLIVCSLIYTVSVQIFKFEDGYVRYSMDSDSMVSKIMNWISNSYGYANVIMALFIALWIKLFFKSYGYNYFEIMILLCFLMGVGMLIFAFVGIATTLVNSTVLDSGFLVGIVYIAWGIGDFFGKHKIMSFFLGFLSYILGMLVFMLLALGLGLLMDHFY